MLSCEQIKRLLALIGYHELEEDLYFRGDKDNLRFLINCNDIFYWAAADAVLIENEEDINLFERSINDCINMSSKIEAEDFGPMLFCAAKRKMRPQDAVYQNIPNELWPLFNKCGPERELGFGNPGRQV